MGRLEDKATPVPSSAKALSLPSIPPSSCKVYVVVYFMPTPIYFYVAWPDQPEVLNLLT